MRLYVLVVGSSLGMILSGFLTSLLIPLRENDDAFPVPAHSTRLMQQHTKAESVSLVAPNNTDTNLMLTSSMCPPWKPKRHKQVLIVAFHPEKTAGSTIGRFLELQDQVNGGDFEMMTPWDETWLLTWLGDADFRSKHPRVFCHLHGKGSMYKKRAFSRERVLDKVSQLPKDIQNVIQANAVDPSATGFFEYLVKLLVMHAPRLENEGARVLAVPSWREPGDHFVSATAFLDFTHKRFRDNKLGVMGHARRALDSLDKHEKAEFEYYKPEVLLLYYYGLDSPLVEALHSVTQVENVSLLLSQNVTDDHDSTQETHMSFMEAYNHIHNFVLETSNITLWTMPENIDQSLLLLAQEGGFRLYEEETCLPLWDTRGQNVNPQRKRHSKEENIVAGIARAVLSPGASIVHPLLIQAHESRWRTQQESNFDMHMSAIQQARTRFTDGVSEAIRKKRKTYKVFLQKERFPRPGKANKKNPK